MNTQTKFTPWYVDGFGIRAMVRDSSHRIILVRHRLGGEENEQVMRHAAAAPDLYAALEALLHEDGGTLAFSAENPKAIAARTALKRARGEG